MKILDNIFKGKQAEIVGEITTTIDKLSTSDDEKLNAKNELTNIVTRSLNELSKHQKEAIALETQGTILQRSWRPIVMLAFATIVVYNNFIAPAFSLPNTPLQPQFWNLLEIGIGGYVIGRSVEKVADRVTKNIDVSFVKKRKRQI